MGEVSTSESSGVSAASRGRPAGLVILAGSAVSAVAVFLDWGGYKPVDPGGGHERPAGVGALLPHACLGRVPARPPDTDRKPRSCSRWACSGQRPDFPRDCRGVDVAGIGILIRPSHRDSSLRGWCGRDTRRVPLGAALGPLAVRREAHSSSFTVELSRRNLTMGLMRSGCP